ncbi:RNA polymerase sigma factor (plasmid) [Isosphaeraceae bacterium EP7]
MASSRGEGAARDLASLLGLGAAGSLTDGRLVGRFADGIGPGSEQAFAALVDRHGPMVMATCRSVLRDEHDARDACQATFLVLARKARSMRDDGSIGPWLHRVAFRSARASKAMAERRRGHERVAAGRNREKVTPADVLGPVAGVVHEEIGRLPERYRGPIVLCELEGHPLEHAAHSLGCPVGTIKSRLSRGRLILRDRLAGRGLDPSKAVGIAVGLGRVAVPAEMVANLARSAVLVRAGLGLATGLVPAAAIESASLVLGSFSMITIKTILMASVAAALIGVGAAADPQQRGETQPTTTTTQAGGLAPTPNLDAPRPAVKETIPSATSDEVRRIQAVLDQLQARVRQLEARPESTLAPTPIGAPIGKTEARAGTYGFDDKGEFVETTAETPKAAVPNRDNTRRDSILPRPDTAPAPAPPALNGVIVFKGEPVDGGKVIFHLADGEFVGGKIEHGVYKITRVPVGTWRVSIEGKGMPGKYSSEEATPLTVQVNEGKNTFDFELN